MKLDLTQIILGLIALLAVGLVVTIKLYINNKSKKTIQKNIKAKGDVAGGDIDKSSNYTLK